MRDYPGQQEGEGLPVARAGGTGIAPVVLTVYARAELSVCARILQTLAIRQYAVERLVADLNPVDQDRARGLEQVAEPVMRMSVAITPQPRIDLERLVNLLNRLIDVYTVEPSF